jgi:alpha 1,3-glucosidase
MRAHSKTALLGGSLLVAACILLPLCDAFKSHEFRYCQDTSFCRRHRKFDGTIEKATYSVHDLQQLGDGSLKGELRNEMDASSPLTLSVLALADGIFRVKIDELSKGVQRYQVQDVLVGDVPNKPVQGAVFKVADGVASLTMANRRLVIQLAPKPFTAHLELSGKPVVSLNPQNKLKWEVLKNKGDPGALEDITGDNDGLWEETFGSHRDSRPKGPASVSALTRIHIAFLHVDYAILYLHNAVIFRFFFSSFFGSCCKLYFFFVDMWMLLVGTLCLHVCV